MDRRIALSPKKLRSANISPLAEDLAPSSPSKRSRSCQTSPRRDGLRCRSAAPDSPTRSRVQRTSQARSSPRLLDFRQSSPVKLSPFKVFTEDAVYATDIDSQIASNEQLVLSPPQKSSTSPSPLKRRSMNGAPRRCLQSLHERPRIPRITAIDPFTLPQNAFLTPPRPRLSPALQVREEERLCKSASPSLGCRGPAIDHAAGFTIYVDSSEYYAICDLSFSRGRDVNKENLWGTTC